MSSTKTWVIFEEEENTVTQRTNTTTTTQPWMIGSHEIQSAGLDQLKIISTSFGCSKYSVFDSLRKTGPLQIQPGLTTEWRPRGLRLPRQCNRWTCTERICNKWDHYIADSSAYDRSFPCKERKNTSRKGALVALSWFFVA